MADSTKQVEPHPLLIAYEDTMVATLRDRTDRRRFMKVLTMSQHASKLERLFAEARVSSYKHERGLRRFAEEYGDGDEDDGGHLINGIMAGPPLGVGGGESQDMIRNFATLLQPLLDGQSRRVAAEASREVALAMAELCRTRELMTAQSLPTTEIDARINQMREEIGNGTATMVPAVVLRGREADENGQEAHEGVVGEADSGREDGSRCAGGESRGEVVPANNGNGEPPTQGPFLALDRLGSG